MEREKFDRNKSRKNIESIGTKNNFIKKTTLIAFRNLLTTSCMEIDGSVFYYKFKKNDDGASMLHLTRVEGGLYENIPPIQQYKVLVEAKSLRKELNKTTIKCLKFIDEKGFLFTNEYQEYINKLNVRIYNAESTLEYYTPTKKRKKL